MEHLTPEQALRAFQALLKQEGIEEIEVRKICFSEYKYMRKVVFVVKLDGHTKSKE